MPSIEGAAAGRERLAERIENAPDFVARVPEYYAELLDRPEGLPRCLVTTGIGTSEGHARHLAEVAARWLGQPARFAHTAALARATPPGAEADWLVVFSQGLSPNARYAFCDVDAWRGVVLVTGLPGLGDPERDRLTPEKRAWLDALAEQGVVQLDLGCGTEYGTLLRVIGARAGYAAGWSLLRSLLARQLRSSGMLDCDPVALRDAQRSAKVEARRVFPVALPVHPFFDADRSLLLVAEEGMLELADQLSLKIAEGMLRPAPRCVDVLHFAHGPLQSHFGRRTSILYLAGPDAEWVDRFRSTLEVDRHDLRVLCSTLRSPFSVIEFEAMFDDLVLRVLDEQQIDLVDWPGREAEAPLYASGPRLPERRERATGGVRVRKRRPERLFDESVWREIESDLESGSRTALIGLGSIEQHGPHLPLGTDHWIAEALAQGLAARLEDAIALPALSLGCAREHLDFPGTLSIEPETLEQLLGDLLDSLVKHGFRRAFVWTAHGGNVDAMQAMRERLTQRASAIELVLHVDLARVARMQAAAVRAEGIDPDHAGPHAGEYETSLVAALRPGSVRRALLAPGRVASAEEAQGFFYPNLRENAPEGVVGDPSRADADRGLRYLDAWIDLLEADYRSAFTGRPEKNRQ